MDKERIQFSALRAVALAINGRDLYMLGHSERVAEYCEQVASGMKLSDGQRYFLGLSAWLHDAGNLSTPGYILRKPSALFEEEMEEVMVHPVKGAEIFANEPRLAEVARSIRHHHERFDGTGYPDHLAGEAIPLFSRIILVADAYEAMTHDRAYRPAVPPNEAMERIRQGAGTQFDPGIVERFITVMGSSEK
jgi:HD-GYP domain-containing protein (c-di-GMP phosphodiesterase class II)